MKIPWKFQRHDDSLNPHDQRFFSTINFVTRSASVFQTRSHSKAARMEYLCLDDTHRFEVHQALRFMKKNMAGDHSEYDTFVLFHDAEKSPTAHHGPSFIIWHRFYILMLELSMQKYFRGCMLPYWDNRLLSRSGPNPRDSIYFSEDLLGEANGKVTTGLAANFRTPNSSSCKEISETLARAVPTKMEGLFKEDFVHFLHEAAEYKTLCLPWNRTFESVHGLVHVFVGELMSYLSCAPCDPIFFLHHTFVDYMYEKHFRLLHKGNNLRANLTYPAISEEEEMEWYAGDTIMMPFGILHRDMLMSEFFVPNYHTSPGDVECSKDEDCCPNSNTKYVWCNVETKQCVAKMKEGGKVKPGFPDIACYCGEGQTAVLKEDVCHCKEDGEGGEDGEDGEGGEGGENGEDGEGGVMFEGFIGV